MISGRFQNWHRLSGRFSFVLACFSLATTGRAVEPLTVLTYNLGGNGVADWSTNSPKVQAIGREVRYLQPDVLALQEVPFTNTWQMANFVTAFFPGFFLATNSGTDGYVRSAILSRFPIVRSQKWLDGVTLTNFGFAGNFTRDLFEAEINVPGFEKPLHVFTTHLKSRQDATSSARHAAEARAISNWLVTAFLPSKGDRPYLLTGDLNEDVQRPSTAGGSTLPTLVSAPTGLRLTTPTNSAASRELTWSTGAPGFQKRYDYILPCGLLFSNIAASEVFRADALTNPPPPLRTNDTVAASDHAPVVMWFHNPYNVPFALLSLSLSNQTVALRWESAAGRRYRVETSSNLASWSVVASNLGAAGTVFEWRTNGAEAWRFFRVHRTP
ncbi:MAG: endonuclease/exonuclease/phosphatase family protein [Verrucomicrobia bacterium]|nr:endonuclease/exonuclease/phosphatase family protein [Verrucomicrobiota bacterium]